MPAARSRGPRDGPICQRNLGWMAPITFRYPLALSQAAALAGEECGADLAPVRGAADYRGAWLSGAADAGAGVGPVDELEGRPDRQANPGTSTTRGAAPALSPAAPSATWPELRPPRYGL